MLCIWIIDFSCLLLLSEDFFFFTRSMSEPCLLFWVVITCQNQDCIFFFSFKSPFLPFSFLFIRSAFSILCCSCQCTNIVLLLIVDCFISVLTSKISYLAGEKGIGPKSGKPLHYKGSFFHLHNQRIDGSGMSFYPCLSSRFFIDRSQ